MSTKLVIDGYNFLWQSNLYRPLAMKDFEESREALIKDIVEHPLLQKFDVTLVFDAWKTAYSDGTAEVRSGVKIVYSRGGEKADQVIMRLAGEWTAGAVIVSSDHALMRYAEKKGCGVLSSQQFDRLLKGMEGWKNEEEDEDLPPHEKKGPARRLPKSQRKALARFHSGGRTIDKK